MRVGREQEAVSSKNRGGTPMNKNVIYLALGVLLLALSFPVEAQQPAKVRRIGVLRGDSSPNLR